MWNSYHADAKGAVSGISILLDFSLCTEGEVFYFEVGGGHIKLCC